MVTINSRAFGEEMASRSTYDERTDLFVFVNADGLVFVSFGSFTDIYENEAEHYQTLRELLPHENARVFELGTLRGQNPRPPQRPNLRKMAESEAHRGRGHHRRRRRGGCVFRRAFDV